MPFTFSHPAIVLPLTYFPRNWFSLTGLVIGSLSPDFEYFIRMEVQSIYSHTFGGLFWFDLPLAILLAFIFHNVARNALFDNLPQFFKSRFIRFKQFDWNRYFKKNWLVVIISILIGAASHILWDSFTHHLGFLVEEFPALKSKVEIIGFQVAIFKILQHSSTFIGALVIAFAIIKMPKNKRVLGQINLKYWFVLTGVAVSVIIVRLLTGLNYKAYADLIATGISAILIALILTPLLGLIVEKKF